MGWDDAVLEGDFKTTLAAQAQASAPQEGVSQSQFSSSTAQDCSPSTLYLLRSQEEAP